MRANEYAINRAVGPVAPTARSSSDRIRLSCSVTLEPSRADPRPKLSRCDAALARLRRFARSFADLTLPPRLLVGGFCRLLIFGGAVHRVTVRATRDRLIGARSTRLDDQAPVMSDCASAHRTLPLVIQAAEPGVLALPVPRCAPGSGRYCTAGLPGPSARSLLAVLLRDLHRLLRAHCNRPRRSRAAENRNKLRANRPRRVVIR